MSNEKIEISHSEKGGNRFIRIMKNTLAFITKTILVIGTIVFTSFTFSKLGKIHGKSLPEEYFSEGYPTILKLLDSEFFMGLIFFITMAIIVYVIYLMWQLHEVAVHKAQEMSSAHTQIVFALSLCGLFINKVWWVLAIIIAFTRWDIVANGLSNIIRSGMNKTPKIEE